MKPLLKAIVGLCLFVSIGGYAVTEAEYRARVESTVATLKKLDRDYFKFLERSEVKETKEAYAAALALIEDIGNDKALPEGPKSELLLTLASECGAMFERLTEPFADVKSEPLSWVEIKAEMPEPGVGQWFLRAGRFAWDRVAWYGQSVLRDFLRVWPLHYDGDKLRLHWPFVFPFGSDWNRSRATRDTVGSTVAGLKAQIESELAVDPNNPGLKAMNTLFTSMEKAEPIRWGASNTRFRRFLLFVAAPFLLLHPPVDFWWFTIEGPTQYSLLVSSFFEVGAAMYLGRVRRYDSALNAYWDYRRAQKELSGRPATKWQWLMAKTHFHKLPGMAWFGRGLESNAKWAEKYAQCEGAALEAVGEAAAEEQSRKRRGKRRAASN